MNFSRGLAAVYAEGVEIIQPNEVEEREEVSW
jgi:hypothetical protein